MFDVDGYLSRIGYVGSRSPSVATLRRLHREHLFAVPFDNRVALRGRMSELATDYDAVISRGCGGTCHELNGLFRRLLDELGFDTMVLSAGVRQVSGGYSHDLAHVLTGVRLDGQLWLADVGFQGPSYIEPLPIAGDEVEQAGCRYRIDDLDGYRLLLRRAVNTDWKPVYRFVVQHREARDYAHLTEEFARLAAESVIGSTPVCSRASETGYQVLFGRYLVEVDNGVETSRALVDDEEYAAIRSTILGTSEEAPR